MVANHAAFETGDEMMTCTIDGAPYSQGRFGYQRKCLEWLRDDYRALGDDDRGRGRPTPRRHRLRATLRMSVRCSATGPVRSSTASTFALGQRGIDYELVDVPPSAVRPKGFVLPDEFVAHSPRLEVPIVCVDGDYLADSIPILQLPRGTASTHRRCCPAGPADLVCDRVAHLDATLMPSMGGVAYGVEPAIGSIERRHGSPTPSTRWPRGCADSPWLAGPEPTLVEAIAVPVYLRLPGLVALGFDRNLPIRGGRSPRADTHPAGRTSTSRGPRTDTPNTSVATARPAD